MKWRHDTSYNTFYEGARHIIGFIENDEYYFWGDLGTGEIFRNGYSKWKLEAVTCKKYFARGDVYAYEDKNGDCYGWVQYFDEYGEKFSLSYEWGQKILYQGLRNYSMKIS